MRQEVGEETGFVFRNTANRKEGRDPPFIELPHRYGEAGVSPVVDDARRRQSGSPRSRKKGTGRE